MYHRPHTHAWQHHSSSPHELYPAAAWPEYAEPLSAPPSASAASAAANSAAGPYTHDLLAPRLALAGSLDPATGIFYRSPEHPRLRTAQACEKCRTRKAKCSGEHPTCKRCASRGLVCEYAKEGRVRGPNKPKSSKSTIAAPESSKETPPPPPPGSDLPVTTAPPRRHSEGRAVRPRPSNLRLERHQRHTPHFSSLYAAPDSGDSSGGSVPSSAVSSTFDLSPTHAHAQTFQTETYPGNTHIHHLSHDQQHRLLDLDLDLSHHHQTQQRRHAPQSPQADYEHTHYTHQHQPIIKQESFDHEGLAMSMRFHDPPYPVLSGHTHAAQQQQQQQQQQQYIPAPASSSVDYAWPAQMHYSYDTHTHGADGAAYDAEFQS